MTTQLAKLPRFNLLPGQTFDLRKDRNGRSWNFLLEADRAEAKRLIQEEKPYIAIGSPPCTSFCGFNRRLNYRNMDPEQVRRAIHEGNVLLKFALEIYELQLAEGRHFLHEHLDSAASWQVPRMVALRRRQGVGEVVAHLCQYGLVTPGPDGRPKTGAETHALLEFSSRAVAAAWPALHTRPRAPASHRWSSRSRGDLPACALPSNAPRYRGPAAPRRANVCTWFLQ